MELIDFILHVDDHLLEFITNYGVWIYAILFLIIFVETGLVVMPFLPGDSLLFAAGAKRIPMATLVMIQYGSPTLQMLLGLWLFGEAFNLNRFIGYVWVWAGVALFVFGIWYAKQHR